MLQSRLATLLLLFTASMLLTELKFGDFMPWLLSLLASFRTALYCLTGFGLLLFGIMQLRETWRNDH